TFVRVGRRWCSTLGGWMKRRRPAFRLRRDGCVGTLFDPIDEIPRRVMSGTSKKLRSGRDLDDRTHVATGLHGKAHHTNGNAQDLTVSVVHSDSVVLRILLPELEIDYQINPLTIAHGRHAVEVFHVEDTEPPDLHEMAQRIRRFAEDHPRRPVV